MPKPLHPISQAERALIVEAMGVLCQNGEEIADILSAFKAAAAVAHPDKQGGSAEKMRIFIAARDRLLAMRETNV